MRVFDIKSRFKPDVATTQHGDKHHDYDNGADTGKTNSFGNVLGKHVTIGTENNADENGDKDNDGSNAQVVLEGYNRNCIESDGHRNGFATRSDDARDDAMLTLVYANDATDKHDDKNAVTIITR